MPVTQPLIDMSYILDIAGNDAVYIYEISGIFLDTMAAGLPKLKNLIDNNAADFDKIHAQAHYLKSSAGIIKIRDNYEKLIMIDQLAQTKSDEKNEIKELFDSIWANFEEALPELHEIRNKNKTDE